MSITQHRANSNGLAIFDSSLKFFISERPDGRSQSEVLLVLIIHKRLRLVK
jgi:hypothetical protein